MMSERILDLPGRQVRLLEDGQGQPLLYLHGFADVHGSMAGWQPFHLQLQQHFRVVAPAHPGCAGSTGLEDVDSIEDVVFHYIEVAEALGLDRFRLAGVCLGGWIAAELAARYPERVSALALIAASGLRVPGSPIGDLFMLSRPKDGTDNSELRQLLFGDAESPLARELFPDGRASLDDELLRYRTLTFAGRIGWNPPYFYDRKLRDRLRRISCPVLALWGRDDRMVPPAHASAYAEGVPHGQLRLFDHAGHSPHLELPQQAAEAAARLLEA